MKVYQQVTLLPKDTNGLELRWGNAEAIIGLTEMIIRREGLGDPVLGQDQIGRASCRERV